MAIAKPASARSSNERDAVAYFTKFMKHMRIKTISEAIRLYEDWKATQEAHSHSTNMANLFDIGKAPPAFEKHVTTAIAGALGITGLLAMVAGFVSYSAVAAGAAATSLYAAGGGLSFIVGAGSAGLSIGLGVAGIILIALVIGALACIQFAVALKATEAAEAMYGELEKAKRAFVVLEDETSEEEHQSHLTAFLASIANESFS